MHKKRTSHTWYVTVVKRDHSRTVVHEESFEGGALDAEKRLRKVWDPYAAQPGKFRAVLRDHRRVKQLTIE